MAGPSELVTSTFSLARDYAQNAQDKLGDFTDALADNIFTPSLIDVSWASVPAPALPGRPPEPPMPDISLVMPTTTPGELSEALPTIQVDTFTEAAPTLQMPVAPTLSYGAVPAVPDIADVAVPGAPTIEDVPLPTLLAVNAVPFAGVNLREDWLQRLENLPELEIVAPTPFEYAPGPQYASQLLDSLKAVLRQRIAGGTGLPPEIEQAIWDRARSRETHISLGNQAQVLRTGEALGFPLPPGVLAEQLRNAQREHTDKLSELSRDIAIKQADLEQANLRDTIAAGMQLEGQLIQYSLDLEKLTFESARVAAENAVQVFNGRVAQFQALMQAFQTYAAVYKTIIDGELSKVEVYKAQLQGEQAKADINRALVDQYKAQVEASMSRVEIFRAQVGAAQTLVELERAKIGAAGEQIRGFVAQVNAETAKVEAYKASVEAEAKKIDIYKVKADAFASRVQSQVAYSNALVSRYSAIVQAKTAEWSGWRARVEAESARMQALGTQSAALLDAYKAANAAVEREAAMHTKIWEAKIQEYGAGRSLALQAAKANNEAIATANAARLDASKAGSQVYAQLVSSALGMMRTSAGISGSGSTSVSYNYSGAVSGAVPPIGAA